MPIENRKFHTHAIGALTFATRHGFNGTENLFPWKQVWLKHPYPL